MQITQEQYEKIAKYLPTQRGNVSMTNLQLINAILYVTENSEVSTDATRQRQHDESPTDQCDPVCHGKWLQVEGIAGNLWELAYNLCSHE